MDHAGIPMPINTPKDTWKDPCVLKPMIIVSIQGNATPAMKRKACRRNNPASAEDSDHGKDTKGPIPRIKSFSIYGKPTLIIL